MFILAFFCSVFIKKLSRHVSELNMPILKLNPASFKAQKLLNCFFQIILPDITYAVLTNEKISRISTYSGTI